MLIETFVVDSDQRKITTYKFTLNDKIFMLDCGSEKLRKEDVSDVDFLFISHEHLDHWFGLYNNRLSFKKDCRILATKTTKEIIQYYAIERLSKEGRNKADVNSTKQLFNEIEVLYYEAEYELSNGISVMLFPSGHTLGSSMIYLKTDELKLLYTGDMDYVKKSKVRKYYFPWDLSIDLLIMDGTNFLNSDFKTQSVNRVAKRVKHIDHITFNVRPEKAVALASMLSMSDYLAEHIIIYEQDLKWYLNILTMAGYDVFKQNKIVLDLYNEAFAIKTEKTIRLSSLKYSKEYNRDWALGLHIARSDAIEFIHNLISKPKVLIGHYDLNKKDEYLKIGEAYNLSILQVGVNKI